MHKVKVLHTDNSLDYTGGFKALFEYIVSEKDKIESVVVLPKGSKCISALQKAGIIYYEVPFLEVRKSFSSFISYVPFLLLNAWRIKKIASDEKVTVLHSNDLYNLTLYIVKYFYRYNLPLVTHLRLMPSSYPSFFYNAWKAIHLKYADELVAVSYAVKKAYGNAAKIHVIYDIIEKDELYAPYQVDDTQNRKVFKFLYLANYTKGKGQDYAIEAFEILASTRRDITLTFAGGLLGKEKNREFKSELMHMARVAGLEQNIIFEDFAADVELKMKQYDCVLNFSPSFSRKETQRMVINKNNPYLSPRESGFYCMPSAMFNNHPQPFLEKEGRKCRSSYNHYIPLTPYLFYFIFKICLEIA